jgi:hypothetical protein
MSRLRGCRYGAADKLASHGSLLRDEAALDEQAKRPR